MNEDRRLHVNGINEASGDYLVPPLSVETAAQRAVPDPKDPTIAQWIQRKGETTAGFGLPFDVDPLDIAQAGWAVVFPEGTADDVKDAVALLIEHRRKVVPAEIFKILDYKANETTRDWLARQGVGGGDVDPSIVPYYVLLVGDPSLIPFSFQYMLGLDYAVGRLAFDTAAEYKQYAASVIAYETAPAVATRKSMVYWGPRIEGDDATTMSADCLLKPLIEGIPAGDGKPAQPPATQKVGVAVRSILAADATKSALADVLHGRNDNRPALLFTASHGLGLSADNPMQPFRQGALITQDWPGHGSPRQNHYLAAADIGDDADLHGLVAFFFACFGAGTPELDNFLRAPGQEPSVLAPKPLVAPLPKRLLAHPKGGALAVIGHVERAWGYSIQPPNVGTQILPFRNTIGRLLSGCPVGHSMRDFRDRYASASTALLSTMDGSGAGTGKLSNDELVLRWIERNDAQSYVILGDPAVRIRAADLSA
jgi:Peptidase family C25